MLRGTRNLNKSARENRVNQSGSVALSAEEVRGPPQRNRLIIMAYLAGLPGYEPGGRGFKSCRARHEFIFEIGRLRSLRRDLLIFVTRDCVRIA